MEKCIAVIEGRVRRKVKEVKKEEEGEAGTEEEGKLERQFTAEQLPVAGRQRKPFK